jgi:hypothetical protein
MRNDTEDTEQSSEYVWPVQREAAVARLAELEAEYAEKPTPQLLALVRTQQNRVRWFSRKHGRKENVGTVSLCTRPGGGKQGKRAVPRDQAPYVPPVGLSDLLPPA